MSPPLGLAPHLHIEYLDEEAVLFVREDEYLVVEGALCVAIFQGIDKRGTLLSELQQQLEGRWEAAVVEEVVGFMKEDRLLEEIAEESFASARRRWQSLSEPSHQIESALFGKSVRVEHVGHVYPQIMPALERWGVSFSGEDQLDVVITVDALDERVGDINSSHVADQKPWLLAKIDEHSLWLTLFIPGRTPCWECLYVSVVENRGMDKATSRQVPEDDAYILQSYAECIAQAAVSVLVEGSNPQVEGILQVRRDPIGESTSHRIRSRGCCSLLAIQGEDGGCVLRTLDLLAYSGGRKYSVEQAYARAAALVSPYTGAFRNLELIGVIREDLGFVYGLKHRMARPRMSLKVLSLNTTGRSFGKGQTALDAQVSALYEGVERYSGIWREYLAGFRSSLSAIQKSVISPDRFLEFSDAQYQQRETWNEENSYPMLFIPERYDDQEIDWVEGWSLTHQEARYVPAALTFYDHPDAELGFAVADSNGCASGGTYAEAVWSGLMEVIERDAIAIWWYNQLRRPAIDLSLIDESYVQRQPAVHKALGRDLWVLDITTDIEVPVCVAVSKDPLKAAGWVIGFGCHSDPVKALKSALLELAQVLTTDSVRTSPPEIFDVELDEDGPSDPMHCLIPASDMPARIPRDMATHVSTDLHGLVNRLSLLDLEMIVLDQTDPDIGIPVVKTIVPGCGHHWRRLGCQRLYEVPVKMGWLPRPNTEDELNPVSLIL